MRAQQSEPSDELQDQMTGMRCLAELVAFGSRRAVRASSVGSLGSGTWRKQAARLSGDDEVLIMDEEQARGEAELDQRAAPRGPEPNHSRSKFRRNPNS